MNYAEMMQRYAEVAGLPRRRILPVPLFTPSLSSHWVGSDHPGARGHRPAAGGVAAQHRGLPRARHRASTCRTRPEGLLGFDEAVRLALQRVKDAAVATRWSSASVPGAPSDPLPTDPDWAGGSLYVDERTRADRRLTRRRCGGSSRASAGDTGWYSFPLAWEVRGRLDRLVGGVGLRRGRRDPHDLYVGDALDFWRVEELEEGSLLRLRAEMRLPGLAWLEFHVEHEDADGGPTRLRQRATFVPRGLLGHLYWWAVAPFHGIVFGGMLRNITRAAEAARLTDRGVPAPAVLAQRAGVRGPGSASGVLAQRRR